MEKNKLIFEKKWFDRVIPLRFKINYWLLQKLGLFGFALFAFIWGFIASILLHKYIVPLI